MKNLIVDLNNLAFVTRFSKVPTPPSKRRKDEYASRLIFFEMLSTVAYVAHINRCDAIVVTCDSKNVWRHDIYDIYKASSETSEDIYYRETLEAADMFKAFMRENTSSLVLSVERCEADDIIGYWCLNSSGVENMILSTDKDFIQLLDENTSLYSVTQKEFRQSQNPDFDLFVKCMRGDKNDNIESALPRVRQTRLEKAYADDIELLNLFETVRKDGRKVFDVFDLNRRLIDLSMQPEWVVENIKNAIEETETGRYSEAKTMRYLSDLGLKAKADVLDGKSRPFRVKPVMKIDTNKKVL